MKLINPSKLTSRYRANLILKTYSKFIKRKDRVLDLGCGTGVVTTFLAENLDLQIYGCDVKNYLLQPLPFFYIKENSRLPFKKGSYDVVMLNDVLHHIDAKHQNILLNEALRVGKRVLIFEAKPTIRGKIFDVILNKFHYGDLKTPLTFRNEKDWIKLFNIMRVRYKTIYVKSSIFYPFSHIAFKIARNKEK